MKTFPHPTTGARIWNLSRSVGWGYSYLIWDAKLVQYMLNVARIYCLTHTGNTLFPSPLKIDGKVGPQTDTAIRSYIHETRRKSLTPGVFTPAPSSLPDIQAASRYAFIRLLGNMDAALNGLDSDGLASPSRGSASLVSKPMPAHYPVMPADLRGYLKNRWDSGA